jgi:CRISPR-associated protein Cas1
VIKRTIEISREPAYITTQHKQLVLKREGQIVGSVPCEDLGMVVVDNPGTTYSHAALTALVESAATVVVCRRNHLPVGILLPLSDHTQVVWRIHDQLRVRGPLRKRLWKQLVRAKILGQAENLAPGSPPRKKLVNFAREVRSGDPSNLEAQAARAYWPAWLVNAPEGATLAEVSFSRDRAGVGPNSLLNYGYAIVRAGVARAIVAAGLMPAIGLHHSNRSNAFCLADDFVEPFRPIVDERVRELYFAGQTELDQPTKAALLELLAMEVQSSRRDTTTGPLMVALHRMVASFVRCCEGLSKDLEIPVRIRHTANNEESAPA